LVTQATFPGQGTDGFFPFFFDLEGTFIVAEIGVFGKGKMGGTADENGQEAPLIFAYLR
jgi:hypothetical protein